MCCPTNKVIKYCTAMHLRLLWYPTRLSLQYYVAIASAFWRDATCHRSRVSSVLHRAGSTPATLRTQVSMIAGFARVIKLPKFCPGVYLASYPRVSPSIRCLRPTNRIDNLTRLIHTLAIYVTIHTCIPHGKKA